MSVSKLISAGILLCTAYVAYKFSGTGFRDIDTAAIFSIFLIGSAGNEIFDAVWPKKK